jgi:hypothetical protein
MGQVYEQKNNQQYQLLDKVILMIGAHLEFIHEIKQVLNQNLRICYGLKNISDLFQPQSHDNRL